jgi:hypothetical protein
MLRAARVPDLIARDERECVTPRLAAARLRMMARPFRNTTRAVENRRAEEGEERAHLYR